MTGNNTDLGKSITDIDIDTENKVESFEGTEIQDISGDFK